LLARRLPHAGGQHRKLCLRKRHRGADTAPDGIVVFQPALLVAGGAAGKGGESASFSYVILSIIRNRM